MNFYEQFPESRARSGIGCGLYYKNESGKFSLLLPLETIPVAAAAPGSIDIDVTTVPYIGKAEGKATLDEKESEFFVHRDAIRVLKKLAGQKTELMVVNPDFTGYRYDGVIHYFQNDATSGDPLKGTLKILPSADFGFVDNCYDMLQPTAKFASSVPEILKLKAAEKESFAVVLDPSDAVVEVISETTAVATASVTDHSIEVTGVAAGSAVLRLSASKSGHASWETTVLVIVEAAA